MSSEDVGDRASALHVPLHSDRERLETAKHEVTVEGQNLSDLRAQIAANEKGGQELRAMVAHYGRSTVSAYMQHVQDNAEDGAPRHHCTEGRKIHPAAGQRRTNCEVSLAVNVAERRVVLDFSGTSSQLANNFNAPKWITMAAVLYVFRTLVDDAIPLNAGCLKPIEVIVPQGCMLNPEFPAAVVAGNVEPEFATNAIYGALGVMAAAQCTMNNFTFGNDSQQYYETISGVRGRSWLRWNQRGPDPHDQFASHGSRDSGTALPGSTGLL